ncbi:MAG: hypothetical protein HOP95_08225 [Sphingomonas sp.]|nr:hypothetical protein [Sphingomonas sp.]
MMVVALPVALAMLAPAAEAAPSTPLACSPPSADSSTIVICTQRPNGYRLNPDVMEAKRATRSPGRPVRPGGGTPRPDCSTVGPMPCANAGINLLGAALTAAEMAKRLAAGQEVGSMFLTDPKPDEYHLYLAAKARREAEEAQKAADAKAKAAADPPTGGN